MLIVILGCDQFEFCTYSEDIPGKTILEAYIFTSYEYFINFLVGFLFQVYNWLRQQVFDSTDKTKAVFIKYLIWFFSHFSVSPTQRSGLRIKFVYAIHKLFFYSWNSCKYNRIRYRIIRKLIILYWLTYR